MSEVNEPSRPSRVQIGLLVTVTLVIVGWALRATYPVTMPLVLAFFLAVLVFPVQAWIVHRVPHAMRWLGPAASLLLVIAVLGGGAALVIWSLSRAAGRLPHYQDQLQQSWQQLVDWANNNGIPLADNIMGVDSVRQHAINYLTAGVTSFWWWIALLVVILFLMLLMLLEVRDWRGKLHAALCCGHDDATIQTLDAIAHKLRRYLLVRTAMSLLNGVAVALWLWLLGVEFWYLWGLTTFVLNYIPNLGSILAVVPPAIIAMLQFGWGWATLAIGGMALIDQFIGNYLDPRLQGKTLDISPVVVLAVILLWAWIWGVVGMLLAVPITVCIILISEQVHRLHPVAQFLKRKPDPSLTHQPTPESPTPPTSSRT